MTTKGRIPHALMASEWTKVASVRSTYLIMAGAVVIAVAGGLFGAHGAAHEWSTMTQQRRDEFDPVNISYDGLALAQVAFAALGVMAIAAEYATGMIRTTFTATPRPRTVLAGKAAVVGLVALVLGEVFSLATFLLAQIPLQDQHLDVTLGHDGVLRAVSGAGFYLSALALIGLGLGALLRHTGAAISAVFGLIFVVPILANTVKAWTTLPQRWNLWSVGNALITINRSADQPAAGTAALACCVYVVAVLGAATLAIGRRDA